MGIINPAYVGVSDGASFIGTIRSQWVGIKGAPELQTFSFGMPMGKNVGLGVSIISDKVFVESRTSLSIDFSYRLRLTGSTDLFLGLKGSGNSYGIKSLGLQTENGPVDITLKDANEFSPNVGVGAYLSHNSFYMSLSTPKLLKTKRVDIENGVATMVTNQMHVYLGSGYRYGLTDSFGLRGAALLKYVVGAPVSTDFLASVVYNGNIELGIAYSTDNIMGGFLSVKVENWLGFGYAYSNSTRVELSQTSGGIHEVFIRLNIAKTKKVSNHPAAISRR